MRSIIVFIFYLCVCLLAGGQPVPGGQAKPGQQKPKPLPAQTPPPAQNSDAAIQAKITQTASATIRWDKSTSPGAKAQVLLIKKDQSNGRPLMQYHLKVTGAPRNKVYSLITWPITALEPATVTEGLGIAADGTVGCPPNTNRSCAQSFKGAELILSYTPTIGEIYRHALISEDHQTRIFFSIVPAPMVEHDRACSMEVIRLSPRFELALIRGRGFTPGEQVAFHTQSYQEGHDSQPKVDSTGEFWAVLTPFVKGKPPGTMDVSAHGKGCAPVLSFEWGSE
jgi:hypothetical protein